VRTSTNTDIPESDIGARLDNVLTFGAALTRIGGIALQAHFIVLCLMLCSVFSAAEICSAQTPAQPGPPAAEAPAPAAAKAPPVRDATDIVLLLEKSGYKYTKVSDGVWEIIFAGKNTGDFPVRLALAGNIVLAIAKLGDRKELQMDPAFLTRLLECNDQFDFVKISLSKDMLYLRMEATTRLLDGQELKHVLEQVSAATDEIYPQIKQYLPQPK
jgi:hypothetical protein